MTDYTYQVLRVVVAQICQTIGWHSIQSTPLELLVDILHRYLQEITRETYMHTEFYGRTEPNLVDVGLAFRNLNINLTDIEEYINYVEPVPSTLEVPKYPIKKESSLNFLKPGSKEVLTRPVHIPEYLPPIYPENEDDDLTHQSMKKEIIPQANTSSTNGSIGSEMRQPLVQISNKNHVFKKPEFSDTSLVKKPRINIEEEGRPTREISSVMMTSSGFISPAREGKLPDAKSPVLPECKIFPIQSPPSNIASIIAPLSASNNVDGNVEKKMKKKTVSDVNNKNRSKKEKSTENGNVKMSSKKALKANQLSLTRQEKIKLQKKQKNKLKNKELVEASSALLSNTNIASGTGPICSPTIIVKEEDFGPVGDIKPISNLNFNKNIKEEVKLISEPSKEKLNIFKKISSASKKEKEDILKSSSNIFPDVRLLSNIPDGTTITPAPPLKIPSTMLPFGLPNSMPPEDDHVICVDDEVECPSPSSKNSYYPIYLGSSSSVAGATAASPAAAAAASTSASGTFPFRGKTKSHTAKKPRKKMLQQQQQLEMRNRSMQLPNLNYISSPKNTKKNCNIQNLPLSMTSRNVKLTKEKKTKKKPRPRLNVTKNRLFGESMFDKSPSKNKDNLSGNLSGMAESLPPFGLVPPAKSLQDHFMNKYRFSRPAELANLSEQSLQMNLTQQQHFPPSLHMFPFYPFPPRPGLIPNPTLFNHLQPLPEYPAFNKLLMRFKNYKNVNKESKQSSPNLSTSGESLQLPPDGFKKTYCNVAPLVPESMKLQLSPPHSSSSSISKQKTLTPKSNEIADHLKIIGSGGGGGGGVVDMNPNDQDNYDFNNPSSSGSNLLTTSGNKNFKDFIDAPIEISDDEKPKSDFGDNGKDGSCNSLKKTEDMIDGDEMISSFSLQHDKEALNIMNQSKFHSIYDENEEFNVKSNNNKMKSSLSKSSIIGSEQQIIGSGREEKLEKRRDKEHKKGKKGKDGKIKKKKDKKDKSKSKEKSEKRKEKESKKEKERLKKIKKEKKKHKMKLQVGIMNDDFVSKHSYNALNLSNKTESSDSVNNTSTKLTLKLGIGNSPGQENPDNSSSSRKLSVKSPYTTAMECDDLERTTSKKSSATTTTIRRESSPELARISPLITRPPKQKQQSSIATASSSSSLSSSSSESISNNLQHQQQQQHQHQQIEQSREWSINPSIATTSSSSPSTSYNINNSNNNNNNNNNNSGIIITENEPKSSKSSRNIFNYNSKKMTIETKLLPERISTNHPDGIMERGDTKFEHLQKSASKSTGYSFGSSSRNSADVVNSLDLSLQHGNQYNMMPSEEGQHHQNERIESSAIVKQHHHHHHQQQQQQPYHQQELSSLQSTATSSSSSIKKPSNKIFPPTVIEQTRPSSYIDAEGNQVWICPACGRVDDGTMPMIGCDGCDAWYHWVCVGIQVPPDVNEDWYCRVCITKKQEAHGTSVDKKRKRKKKKQGAT